MKKEILFLFIASLFLTFTASAQDPEHLRKAREQIERGQKTSAALDAIANKSFSLKALRGDVSKMIVEAAKTGDVELKPHLKVLASDEVMRTRRDSVAFYAHIALAKLGDSEVLPEIFAELNSTDRVAQDMAIAKLVQIGNKEAFRKLYQLLDDNTNRDDILDDELVRPKSEKVMYELGNIFDDVPKQPSGVVSFDAAAWKSWFGKNKHLIE